MAPRGTRRDVKKIYTITNPGATGSRAVLLTCKHVKLAHAAKTENLQYMICEICTANDAARGAAPMAEAASPAPEAAPMADIQRAVEAVGNRTTTLLERLERKLEDLDARLTQVEDHKTAPSAPEVPPSNGVLP